MGTVVLGGVCWTELVEGLAVQLDGLGWCGWWLGCNK